ncbi:hypothetical protein SCLCIDRAFT_1208786 [Scleroderma citrinum Foug A]|uniref:RRM domain-containing protein n=1 Tax=Scleroderma citrinum Foug A TaxID=1036808 RepID=A0A0C3AUH3_9AGAM|nr:hypothetical protein SCLCIDRAFT_1208786 [Scleroderma citrinum Foug A]
MAKFRAPSASANSSTFGSASNVNLIPAAPQRKVTQKPAKIKKALDPLSRTRVNTDKARATASNAYKKARKQTNHPLPSWAYVFVGNIGPAIDEPALMEHFKRCGNVVSAHIRCSGGIATTVKPQPDYYRNHKVHQYGVITFSDKRAVRNAILLNGSQIGDCEIAVCRSAGELPEVKEKIQKRLDEYRARHSLADARRAQQSALRSLRLEPTILIDPTHALHKRNRKWNILGFSFPAGLMG